MRAAGYTTGAFLSNPLGYYLAESLKNEFDFLPEPTFQQGGAQHLWQATSPLHQDSGIGSRLDEYTDLHHVWNFLGRLPSDLSLRFRAVASFEDAREVLAKLPDGFLLWVHVMTPHYPYLPDVADRGRFHPDDQPRTEQDNIEPWVPHYEPDQQSQVDELRLIYDECIATADRAFGAFMSNKGSHVQQKSRIVAFAADQTALAPTILELAGQPKPDRMRGQSLVGWLNSDGEGEGLAFCQHLENNSVFKPLRHGTVGVIDGQYQYVVILYSQKGSASPR